MYGIPAGAAFPKMSLPRVGGGHVALGNSDGDLDWQLIVVYRGLHCPKCKDYLAKLEALMPAYHEAGVAVVAISGDGEAKAQQMVDEVGLTMPVGYDLSLSQMASLGLYISDPRSAQETDQPFPEPGTYVINDVGTVQIVDVSNAPFARPDLELLLGGIRFVRANDYPIRGMHRRPG